MKDDYWIVRDGVGIRCFPRAGSTTILRTYGYGQSVEKWMKCKERYVVVRNPWERLLSAHVLYQTNRYTNVPEVPQLDNLLDYIIERPTEEVDNHCRSQHALLEGYEPKDSELILMEEFLKDCPTHARKSMKRPPSHFTSEKYEWWKAINIKDFGLYDRATREGICRRRESRDTS